MKKLFSLGLVLVLLLSVLSGCSLMDLTDLAGSKELTFDDLTITVPGMYIDLKKAANNDALSFLYGLNDTAVMGIQESITDVKAVSPSTDTTKEYAELFIQANKLNATVTEKDGLVTFTYTATIDNQSFTYVCAAFMSEENFWMVQAYCYAENFKENESQLWDCLKSVKVK